MVAARVDAEEAIDACELNQTAVTDAGLKELVGLSQLRDLALKGTKVTKAGMAEFRRAHPKCIV
jgi:internalin A